MSQSVNTKEKILQSAIEIFSEKGFVKTKVSDIVSNAGLSQGTFYTYFKSKDECFIELLTYLHQSTLRQMEELIEYYQEGSLIIELMEFFIKKILNHKPLVKIFLYESLSYSNSFYLLHYDFKRNFIKIFEKAIVKSKLKIENLEVKLLILSGTIREIMDEIIIKENLPEEIIKENLSNEEILEFTIKCIKEIFGDKI